MESQHVAVAATRGAVPVAVLAAQIDAKGVASIVVKGAAGAGALLPTGRLDQIQQARAVVLRHRGEASAPPTRKAFT
jgi:hypothetical protein